MKQFFAYSPIAAALAIAACTAQNEKITDAYDGIGEDEVVSLGGTEPFWGAEVDGEHLTFSTPDNPDGTVIEVTRFAGNGGLSYSGELNGEGLTAMITPGECSDGMSDHTYPYTATVRLGELVLEGCGHTDKQPYSGGE